jgi:hypothetical protein
MRPKNPAEARALATWRQSRPHAAMRILAEAGYDRAARQKFLVKVAGCNRGDAREFAEVT